VAEVVVQALASVSLRISSGSRATASSHRRSRAGWRTSATASP